MCKLSQVQLLLVILQSATGRTVCKVNTHPQYRTLIILSQCVACKVGEDPTTKSTQKHIRSHTCLHTLCNPLIHPCLLHSPPCCWRHRLWSTDARKFPALILLTFTVTRHFSAWRSSTHSVTDEALLASTETSLAASAAHRSGFWLSRTARPDDANAAQNYGPLLD